MEILMFAIPVFMALITVIFVFLVNKFFPSNEEVTRRVTEERAMALREGGCMSLLGLTKPVPMSRKQIRAAIKEIEQ